MSVAHKSWADSTHLLLSWWLARARRIGLVRFNFGCLEAHLSVDTAEFFFHLLVFAVTDDCRSFIEVTGSVVNFDQLHTGFYANLFFLQVGKGFFQVAESALSITCSLFAHAQKGFNLPQTRL